MDTPYFKTLRIAPTTQQGGTQTIQQSIYLTHNNPCGANLLIFQKMGYTEIRYIDLKNYVDDILKSEQMTDLFYQIRVAGTDYINDPKDSQKFNKYSYAIMEWATNAMANLSVPENYYSGYLFRVNVYDGSGTMYFDSYYPNLLPVLPDGSGNYVRQTIEVLPSNPYYWITSVDLLKVSSGYGYVPFINHRSQKGFETMLSNFIQNQSYTQETVMAISSLLVDSANTRSFGIPRYGFSARQSLSPFSGVTYNCSHFIDIRTIPNEKGETTLIESIFFRLSLEEDTWPPWARDIIGLSHPEIEEYIGDKIGSEEDARMQYKVKKFCEFMCNQTKET